jgi:hypothetical protein
MNDESRKLFTEFYRALDGLVLAVHTEPSEIPWCFDVVTELFVKQLERAEKLQSTITYLHEK